MLYDHHHEQGVYARNEDGGLQKGERCHDLTTLVEKRKGKILGMMMSGVICGDACLLVLLLLLLFVCLFV